MSELAPYYIRKKQIEISLKLPNEATSVVCCVLDNNGIDITNEPGVLYSKMNVLKVRKDINSDRCKLCLFFQRARYRVTLKFIAIGVNKNIIDDKYCSFRVYSEEPRMKRKANVSSSSSSDLTTLKPVLEKVVERALVKQAHVTRKQEVEDELNLINMQLKKAEQQLKVVKSEENLKNIANSSILEKLDILAKRGEELFAKQQQVTTDTKPTTPIMQVEMKKESRTVSTQSPKARRYLFKAGDRVEADVEWDE